MNKLEKIKLCLKYNRTILFSAWKKQAVEVCKLTFELIIGVAIVISSMLSVVFYPIQLLVSSIYVGLTTDDCYFDNLKLILGEDG